MNRTLPDDRGGVTRAHARVCPYCGAPLVPRWTWIPECSRCDGRIHGRSLPGTEVDVLATTIAAQAIDAAWEQWLLDAGVLLPVDTAPDPTLQGLCLGEMNRPRFR